MVALRVALIGSTGSIGRALAEIYLAKKESLELFCFSRTGQQIADKRAHSIKLDITTESSIKQATLSLPENIKFDRVIIATGVLHQGDIKPEKTFKDITKENFIKILEVNTIGPALVAKYFCPLMNKKTASVFAALSARVGSITDNRLGGWYSYRASKAALNMVIKNLSIEHQLRLPQSTFIGLHPGTVKGKLSDPFIKNTNPDKLFSPEFSAAKLYEIIEAAHCEISGQIFDWKGERIDY